MIQSWDSMIQILEFNDSILGFNDSLLGFNECLEDDREKLARTVYAQQLKKVTKTHDDFYRVEKVLRSHMRNKLKENFVKWLGYPEKFNSWVPAEQVKDKLNVLETYNLFSFVFWSST